MTRRPLGRSGFEVAPLALGTNVFGWTVDEPRAFEILDAFVDAGFNLVDTADTYSKWAEGNRGGESETILGRWIAQSGKRDKVLIATKVGMEMPGVGKGLSRKHIVSSVEASLKRLQVETIDLYQSHADDPETPLEETLEAHAALVKQGKVRVIGASNYKADRLAAALDASERLGLPRYESLQPLYNLYARSEFEARLAPLCLERRVGVINYFPLASGFLTGKYRSEADFGQSLRGQGMRKYLNERGMRILGALDQVARSLGAKPSQVAIAWLLAKPAITAPIASATSVAQLRELLAGATLSLDGESVQRLDEASAEKS
jgi:aryl-alcohol dehydrogenase-like predicted oxidoreductase